MKKVLGESWRTTAAGIGQWLVAVLSQVNTLLDADPATMPDWNIIAVSTIAMIGLLSARDNGVSSESVGAK